MASDDEALAALVNAYRQQTLSIRERLLSYLSMLWGSFSEYRSPQMESFAAQMTPMVIGGQRQMSTLTSAFMDEQRKLRGFGSARTSVDQSLVTGSGVRNGADMAEVYSRPFHLIWRDLHAGVESRDAHYVALKAGVDPDDVPPLPAESFIQDAIAAGEKRASVLIQTDLQLAKTHTFHAEMQADKHVTGWRRVLEGESSCGLCIVSSTNVYSKGDLQPIHGGCDCDEMPIYGSSDPAIALNDKLLGDVHDAIAKRFGQSNASATFINGEVKVDGEPLLYRDVVFVHTHSELGPILTVRGQEFTEH